MKTRNSLRSLLLLAAATQLAGTALATDYYWDTNDATAGAGGPNGWDPSGAWATSGTTWSTAPLGSTATSPYTTLSTDDLFFSAGTAATGAYTISLTTNQAAQSLTFQEGRANITGTGGIITLGGTGVIRVNGGAIGAIGGGTTNANIAGSAGLTKSGSGTLILNSTAASSLTGGIRLNGGTLSIERNGTTFTNTNTLTFAGGHLFMKAVNLSGTTLDQTFGNVTVNAGGGSLLTDGGGQVRAQANLGTITATAAGSSFITGIALNSGSGTERVTTTSTNDATAILGGRIIYATGTANTGYDFAINTNLNGGAIGAYTGYTTLPTNTGSSTVNYSMAADTTLDGSLSANTLRIATGATANGTLALGANLLTLQSGGLLVTSNAGNSTVTISGTAGATRLTAGSGSNYDFIVHQFASSNGTTISAVIGDHAADSQSVNFVRTGTGNLTLGGTNTYSGNTYINSGILTLSGSLTSFGNNQRNVYIAPGAAVRGAFGSALYSRLVQTDEEVGLFSTNGANAVDFSATGANLPNAFLGYFAGNGAKFEQTGAITPANGNYRLGHAISTGQLGVGTGSSSLTGSNGLIVGGGVVLMGTGNTFTGETVLRTGAKLILGNNLAIKNSVLNLGSGADGIMGTFGASTGAASGKFTDDLTAASPTFGGLRGSRNLYSAYAAGSAGNNSAALAVTSVTGFTLNVANGTTAIYNGAIGGFGAGASSGTGGASTLTKTGGGTQTLSGNHTYTGATAVNEGILQIGNGVSSTAGTLGDQSNTSIAADAVLSIKRYFLSGTTSANDAYVYTGQLSGSGTFRVEPVSRFDFNADQTNGENLTYDVNGLLAVRAGRTVEIGEIIGSGDVQRGGVAGAGQTVVIGAKNTSTTFSGRIRSDTNMEKVGDGSLILTGTNDYTGTTTVTGGTLIINGSTAGGNVNVNGTSTLGGNGTIGGTTTVAAGANVSPGTSVGTLTFTGALNISAMAGGAGVMNFELDTIAASDKIVAGTVDVGTLEFDDFNFTALGGLENGTYKLIQTGAIPTGSLGGSISGAVGTGTGTLQITGNDIELVVSGIGVGAPEIAVEEPVSTDIVNGGSRDFGTVTLGSVTTKTFTIRNTGAANLNLTGPVDLVAVTGDSDFTVTAVPTSP